MNLQELQEALTNNRIDLHKINVVQRVIIHRLQNKELLKPVQFPMAPVAELTRNKIKMYTDLGFLFGHLFYNQYAVLNTDVWEYKNFAGKNEYWKNTINTFLNPYLEDSSSIDNLINKSFPHES
jgi:hypothetical protein